MALQPEDSHLRSHRRENLKSYLTVLLFYILQKRALLNVNIS
jgi:hypothetical protein